MPVEVQNMKQSVGIIVGAFAQHNKRKKEQKIYEEEDRPPGP